MVNLQITQQSQHDLLLMESIVVPLSFGVLVWVFGGLFAAALPLAVGVVAILGSLAVLRVTTFFTDVSIFALNLTTAMGLALAIDYTLLMISRYREELAAGAGREEALTATMLSAGRTVLFSATTVALSMAVMVLFPMHFLRSFAYAGVATVAFAALAAIVITPAAIMVLGDRLDSLDVRRLVRRALRRPEPLPRPIERQFWYRSTRFVMKRALPIGLAGVALLLLLGAPFLGVRPGFPDDRVLPTSASAHQVGDLLRSDFANNSATSVPVLIPDSTGLSDQEISRYAAHLSRVSDVSAVSAPTGTFVGGKLVGPPSAATGTESGSTLLTVESATPLFSDRSETQLDGLHAVEPPGDRVVEFGGTAQTNRDSVHAIVSRLPLVLGLIAVITLMLLFLLTGSVVLPDQGHRAQRAVAERGIRCDGVDIPGREPRCSRHDVDRHPGRQHSGAAVLHRVRVVDGLRGVPGFPNPGVLARLPANAGRQRRERRVGGRAHRAGDHRRGADHGDLVRRFDRRARVVHADVRPGSQPCGRW